MLKLLLKKQLTEIFRSYFYDSKKNKARTRMGTIACIILFAALMVLLLGGIFTYLSLSICRPLTDAGMDWLYFALMGLISLMLGVFGSVFNTYSSLYLSKDNDLLLSLPIPVSAIMASRLLGVYLMGLMYSLVVILPAVIVYWVSVSAVASAILGGFVLMLLISGFALALSCALGWVVAKISLKLKNKSLITVVISLAFIALYYFVYFRAMTLISDLIANAAVYGAKLKSAAHPLYLFGCVGTGDGTAILIVSAVMLALTALMWLLLSHSFVRIATSTGDAAKKAYRQTAVKQKNPSAALLEREFLRFISSPSYVLNCGLGILFLLIISVVLLLKGNVMIAALLEIFAERAGCIPVLLCAGVCGLAGTNVMTAPSVSLEGKSLYLIQSLPVTPWQALRAKLGLQLILTGIPTLLCVVCIAIVYPQESLELALTALVPLAFGLLSALFGLFIGLKMPNLSWTSEIKPIKQSLAVVIALFSGFVYSMLLCAGFMLLDGWKLGFAGYMSCFALATLALCAVLWLWLKNKGSKRFAIL